MFVQDLKLRRARSGKRPPASGKRSHALVGAALDHVRTTLQDMPPEDRRTAILEMSQKSRMILLTFMQGRPTGTLAGKLPATGADDVLRKRKCPDAPRLDLEPLAEGAQQSAHVHAIQGSGRTRFQATARFRGIRFYTREYFAEDVVLDYQSILTRMLAVLFELEASSPHGWQDLATDACQAVLCDAGTSESALGLRAYVRLRAHRHLARHAAVTSRADSLCRTFEVHRRLHQARGTSWDALRAEWLQLLQVQKGVSVNEATRHIDGFRRAKLRGQLATALQEVDRAVIRRRGWPSG